MKGNWQTLKLGDVCDFEGGSQPPKSEFIFQAKSNYVRFLQIRDFGSDKNITYIPEAKKNRKCVEDDILIGRYGASVGKILTNKSGAYNVALMKTIPDSTLLTRSWFFNYLISDEFQNELLNVAERSAQAGFSKDDIYNFPILIPSILEQQRIVSLLDQAFEGLAKARANAQQNLQNARALFESHLQSIFTQGGDGYEAKIFDEVLEIKNGKDQKPVEKAGGKYPIYGSAGNVMGWTDSYICDEHTTIIGRKGTINRPIFIETKFWNVDTAFGLAAKPNLNAKFLYFFCLSYDFSLHNRGTTIPSLVKTDLLNIKISVPSLSVQELLVKKFTALHNETKRLEALYQRRIALLDELKKSLLQQAFAGEL